MDQKLFDEKVARIKKLVDDYEQLADEIAEFAETSFSANTGVDYYKDKSSGQDYISVSGLDRWGDGASVNIPISWLILEGEELERARAEHAQREREKYEAEQEAKRIQKENEERAQYEKLRAKFGQ